MITQNIGTCAQSEENYGLSCGFPTRTIDMADSSNNPIMYICPNDLMILDPNERVATSDLIIEIDLKPVPVQLWPELYQENPHECPAYFQPAPKKLKFKSKAPKIIHKNFKQPVSRSGFKKGNRN